MARWKRVVAGALVIAFGTSAVPGFPVAQAEEQSSPSCTVGTVLGAGHSYVGFYTMAAPGMWFGYFDADADGSFDIGEQAYLSLDSGPPSQVRGLDIRLVPPPSFSAGSQVRASHSDFGRPWTPFTKAVRLLDDTGDGAYNTGDNVILDGDGSGTVTAGDLRLSPESVAGTRVSSGDSDVYSSLSSLSGAVRIHDDDLDGVYTTNDVAIWDLNNNTFVDTGDFCLSIGAGPTRTFSSSGCSTFGRPVQAGDILLNNNLVSPAGAAAGFFDANGDGSVASGEPYYLAWASNTINPGSIVLSEDSTGRAGKVVVGDHPRVQLVVHSSGATYKFVDDDADGAWDPGEEVFLDRDGNGLNAGDLWLSPSTDAGIKVAAGDARIGGNMGSLASAKFAYYDEDGDFAFSSGDSPLLDRDGSGSVTVGDVCLMPERAASGGSSGGGGGGTPAFGDSDGCNLGAALGDTSSFLRSSTRALGSGSSLIRFFDADGDDVLDRNELLFLDADQSSTASEGDILLSNFPGVSNAGARARATWTTDGVDLTSVASEIVRWRDYDADGFRESDEAAIVDADGSRTVTIGDRWLAPAWKAGMEVSGQDNALGASLSKVLPGGPRFVDEDDDDVLDPDEAIYWDVDDLVVGVQDICLSGAQTQTGQVDPQPFTKCVFGRFLDHYFEPGWPLLQLGGGARFIDENSNGAWNYPEPVYISPHGDPEVLEGDVRLTASGGFAAGSRVDATNPDKRMRLTDMQGRPGFLDLSDSQFPGADGAWGRDDLLVFDLNGDSVYGEFDFHAAPDAMAATWAASNGPDVGRPLEMVRGTLAFHDIDADGFVGVGDPLVWDFGNDGVADAFDVCLSDVGSQPTLAAPAPAPGGDGGGDMAPAPSAPSNPKAGLDAEQRDRLDRLRNEPPPTPGLAFAVTGLALTVAALARRRR